MVIESRRQAYLRYNRSTKGTANGRRYKKTAKGKATASRYNRSEKGKVANARYHRSEKGKVSHVRYDRSEKGLKRMRAWRERNHVQEKIYRDRAAQGG